MSCQSASSNAIRMRPIVGTGEDAVSSGMVDDGTVTQPYCTICIRCLFFWIGVAAAVLIVMRNR